MARIATFDLLRFPGPAARNLARVAPTRAALARVDGLVLGRFLGTAAGNSTAGGADLNRWALVGVWEDAEAAADFWTLEPVALRLRDRASERWSATLVPRRSRGRWAGVEPFGPADHRTAEGGPVAVLTRATVRARRLRAFHSARGPVDRVLHDADGLVADVGMGEWPVGQQATFSLWRGDDAVRQFARVDRTHAEVVHRTRQEGWYAEELFVAFRVAAHTGTWDGCDPLEPVVRLARPADLADLNALERAAARRFAGMGLGDLDDALDAELLREGQRAGRLWVADHAGTVVGFALATVVDGAGFLREIDVAESHGRRGIGSALVGAVCAWARAQRHAHVTLTTFRDVPWNEPWYTRLGFRFVPEAARGPELQAIVAREAREGLTPRTVMRLAPPVPTTAT
ncbi:MAG: hypothetical protein NVS1B12_17680 [Acidimicrobiales bacterium]